MGFSYHIGDRYPPEGFNRATSLDNPTHQHLYHWLTRVEFDSDAAEKWLKKWSSRRNEGEVDQARFSIDSLRDKDFYFDVCHYGRVHTNVTGMKRELRKLLSFSGKQLVEVDIACSQPLVLGCMLNGNFSANEGGYSDDASHLLDVGDVVRLYTGNQQTSTKHQHPHHYDSHSGECLGLDDFLDLCERGVLYDTLMTRYGNTNRDKFKRQFLKRCLFCRNTSHYPEQDIFKSDFPEVWQAAQQIKKRDYRHLSHALQRTESRVMIHQVANRLRLEHPDTPVLTVHDSILTTDPDTTTTIIKQEFAKYGIHPTIKRK